MKILSKHTCFKISMLIIITAVLLTSIVKKMSAPYDDAVLKNQMEHLLQRGKPHSVKGDFKTKEDLHCIRTVEQFRNRDGNFIVPPDKILGVLPINVIECLYHRITTTIQTFCAKHGRHGTMNDGWNICEDGCYKPNKNTNVWVISTVNDKMNAESIDLHYKAKVYRHKPSMKYGQYETAVTPKDKSGLFDHSTTFGVWIDEVKRRSNSRDVFILDVENLTEKVLSDVIKNGLLNKMQQLSIRINYSDDQTGIKYLSALKHLRRLFQAGFRIYWTKPEWSCILQNQKRTRCVYLDMIYHMCKDLENPEGRSIGIDEITTLTDNTHFVIPDDSKLRTFSKTEINGLYIRYLTSIQIDCKEVLRLGLISDGGWNVCHDKQYRPSYPCLVYSFGIYWDFSFDEAVAETYGCEIHSFDPSMNTSDFKRGDFIWFHKIGLSDQSGIYGKNKWKILTLQDILTELNHTSRTLDILKMDIEFMEWQSLLNMIKTGALRNIRQLYVEFHGSTASLQNLQTLRSIYNEGYRIYWYHRNPAKTNIRKWKFVENTSCYEIYFLKI
ncbi:uncharacterized protein LOC127714490 isoform X1 [Mytilus californianus]|uniref:uncharacterized protein LOC127714490 isoform X1 n=2 Tax=Mytilus californianus TaxID=6549 RepID=UPI002245E9FC|nr:uncharacterized protein LOC127714490 isoform X1 [Mytilus californianus]XP_052076506.1 uncharacterized protein LOC127714490 isoform X1 [Mytilus californianus]